MKKRFLAITLALALCMGLAIPAFAADETEAKSVTVNGITLSDVVITDQYDTFPAEDFDFPEGFYHMGRIGFPDEETGEYGYQTFGAYIVPDDAVITFDLTEGSDAIVDGYTLKEAEKSSSSVNSYAATYTGGISPADPEEESITLTKSQLDGELQEFIPEYDLLICCVGENDWVFIMFESKAAALVAGETPVEPDPAAPEFTDVEEGMYYTDAVNWAVAHEPAITNGTSETTFEPDTTCTQAQILTFLYRAAQDEGAASASDMVLAVAWAAQKGMIDAETFESDAECTRADAVSFIWQAFDKPEADKSEFKDVDAEAAYAAAVDWAVANGITNGTDMEAGEFSPDEICTRGQIVTFLHRAYVEEARLAAPAEAE